MLDPRFFDNTGPVSLRELAERTGAELADAQFADRMVAIAAPLNHATADAVSFVSDKRFLPTLAGGRAGAVFLAAKHLGDAPPDCAVLITRTPQGSWAIAADLFHRLKINIHPEGAVHPTARLEDGVVVGPGAIIGPLAEIGAGTIIGPYTVIGPGVAIGRDCRIGPHASVFCALIGDRVSLLAGARIGEQGFGVAPGPQRLVDIPQLGRVIIQDGVTVGANSCIDRGAWDDTVIGENSKLDNFVHVAHNVRMGRDCLLAAYTGISGSVTIGDGAAFGGRAGVADHVTIGAGAQLGAAAGVMRDVPAGEVWAGLPGKPIRQWLKETALLNKLVREGRGKGTEE